MIHERARSHYLQHPAGPPCVQTDLEADRQVANVLAELIIGGSLASVGITERTSSGDEGEAA